MMKLRMFSQSRKSSGIQCCAIAATVLGLLSVSVVSCDDDSSKNSCTPVCANDTTAILCVNGEEKITPCGSNGVCRMGQCLTISTDTCTTNSSECVTNNSFRSCIDGHWSEVTACNDGMVCSGGQCISQSVPCKEAQVECTSDNKGYRLCVEGTWSDVISCNNDTVCSGGQCISQSGPCTVTQPVCTPDNRGYRVCVAGTWSDVISCSSDMVCSKGQCVYEPTEAVVCELSMRKCSADNKGFMICEENGGNNAWSSVIACDDGEVCQNGDCISEGEKCTATQPECTSDNKGYRVCVLGNWSDVFLCGDGTVCANGACVSKSDKCTATEPECTSDNKGYRVCVQGVWSDIIACTGTATCQHGQCVGEDVTSKLPCSEVGQTECVSNTRVKVCGKDEYWSYMDCPKDEPICNFDTNKCGPAQCNESESMCRDEETLGTCVDHVWKYDSCPDDKPLCKNNKCQEIPTECKAGVDKLCLDDTHYKVCNAAGNWEEKTCDKDKICNNGECGECKNGNKECSDDQHHLRTCKNGAWTDSTCPISKPYCKLNTDSCEAVGIGDRVSGSFSFCLDSKTLAFSSNTIIDGKSCRVAYFEHKCSTSCITAKDGNGATCALGNKDYTENSQWDACKSYTVGKKQWNNSCNSFGYSSTFFLLYKFDSSWYGDFDTYYIDGEKYKSYLAASCAVCKEMNGSEGDRYRYVPVNQKYCGY
ncbi:MAG: hypothetical protein J6A01_08350 [Proteobacteria bacterium]|nr:hypothetical protein [Pseudomonadota bacterium]